MSRLKARAAPILALITVLMMLMPVVSTHAISITSVSPGSGDKGDTIVVIGSGVTAGKTVELYWDAVQAWDGEKGLLNTTTAKADGSFEVWFDVPEAVYGTHYVWVVDTYTGSTDHKPFTVNPLLDLSSTSGLVGDKITVTGYGFSGSTDVAILFTNTPGTYPTSSATNEPIGTGDGSTKTFKGTLDQDHHPIKPGTLSITDGVETFTDNGDGTLTGDQGGTGKINYVTGEYEVTFNTAPSNGASITANYEYYTDVANSLEVVTTTPDTNSVGTFSQSVTIPSGFSGSCEFKAYDAKGVEKTASFTIGPVITLTPDEGPSGIEVTIKGRGFTGGEKIESGEVKMDGTDCYIENAPVTIRSDGSFTITVVIPSKSKTGDYTITVTPKAGESASATFTLNGLPSIEVEPEHGAQGATISIHGYNFTQLSGKEVKLELWTYDLSTKKADITTLKTTSDGEFTGTFTVPAVASGMYKIKAIQSDYNIETTTSFKVGLMIIILTPSEGPVGTEVTISGAGFTLNGHWNATFNGEAITSASESVSSSGDFSKTFYVPQVDVGTYTVTALDIDSGVEVTEEFKVTDVTRVEVDPSSAPQGYNVTIKGWNFADDVTTLSCVIYNDTGSWTMNVKQFKKGTQNYRDAQTDSDGNFTAWWDFNDNATKLSPGVYTINVTDGHDFLAQATFEVVKVTISIESRKTEYNIGDTVAFDIKCSFPKDDSYIKIYDPDGNLYWRTDPFDEANDMWLKVDNYYTVPYYSQLVSGNPMILPPDAPTGTWTWVWYSSSDKQLANGTFTVLPAVEVELSEKISSLNASIQGMKSDIAGLKSDISGVKSDIAGVKSDVAALKSDVAAAASAAKDAKEAASAAQEAVAEIAETASAAKSAAEEAKAAAEEAKTAASGLTPLIYGAIGVSLIAALAAIVSLIQISRRIAG